jgi:hypothetical protein
MAEKTPPTLEELLARLEALEAKKTPNVADVAKLANRIEDLAIDEDRIVSLEGAIEKLTAKVFPKAPKPGPDESSPRHRPFTGILKGCVPFHATPESAAAYGKKVESEKAAEKNAKK